VTKHLLSLIGPVILAAGCSYQEPPKPIEPTVVTLPSQGFSVHWRATLGVDPAKVNQLFAIDDYIFVYTEENEAEVFRRDSGRPIYRGVMCKREHKLQPPVVLKDWVVYPALSALEVYDRKGKHLRSLPLREAVRSPACNDQDTIYYSQGGRVAAVHCGPQPHSTLPRWEFMSAYSGGFEAAPAIQADTLIAAGRNGCVYAVRSSDRLAAWPMWQDTDYAYRTGGAVLADVKADASGAYVASTDSKLYCFDLNNGLVRWAYYAQTELKESSSPTLTVDSVYLFVPGKGVVAINKGGAEAPTRNPRWSVKEGVRFLAQDDKCAYLQTEKNLILAVDKQTGAPKYTSSRSDLTALAVNTKDNLIFATTSTGELLCVKPIVKAGARGEVVCAE
jgi:hypothetical protein